MDTDTAIQSFTVADHVSALLAAAASVPATALPYRCCDDWEHNMPDDSDWHCVAYDAAEDKLVRVMPRTTRFAGPFPAIVQPMTPEMQPRAHAALVRLYASMLGASATRAVLEPSIRALTRGTRVRLTAAARCMAKDKVTESAPCPKCEGTGQWVNPHRCSDRRPCFGCEGTGQVKRTIHTRSKAEDGKQVWHKLEAGACGVVTFTATRGTFYRGGYNQPGRENTTAYLTLDDGREVQVSAEKLRLDRDPPTEAEILAMAESYAERPEPYYPPFATARTSLL